MNWDLLGHEWAVAMLREHITRGSFRHAYLFTGPSGVGRRTLALRFAQALNCTQPLAPGEPCLVCRTCTQIAAMQHPDLAVVQADRIGGTLKVEQVRDVQHSLALAPYAARFRVALLLRFEEAHPSAANALLKLLEEPPPQVVLLLTAESPERLPPTIVSRCEVLRLRPLPPENVEQALKERWGMPAEQAYLLAHLSGGRPGFALNLNSNPEPLERHKKWLGDHHRLLSSSRVARFQYAEKLVKDRDQLREALETWLSFWRDVLLQASGAAAPIANVDYSEEIAYLSSSLGLESTYAILASLLRTQDLLDRNINSRLATEVFLLSLPMTE